MASIGNALFGQISLRNFSALSGEISDLQERISSGKNDPRPSADPMRAAKLSAVTEQRGAIARFTDNVNLASDRLAQADLAVASVANTGQGSARITEVLPAAVIVERTWCEIENVLAEARARLGGPG